MRGWVWVCVLAASGCGGDQFETSGTGGTSTGGAAGTLGSGGAGTGGLASGGAGGSGGTSGTGGATGGTGGATGGTGGATGGAGGATGGTGGATGGTGGATGGTGGTGASCSGPPTPACQGMNIVSNVVEGDCTQLAAAPTSVTSQTGGGCSDGTREGFFNVSNSPNIAACAGGWTVPGVKNANGTPKAVSCGRQSGNSSSNPNGTCCSVEDLCAAGFHVCVDAAEVATKSNNAGCAMGGASEGLYLTAQGMSSVPACGAGLSNNLAGCSTSSTLGHSDATCAPLSHFWHRQDCCCASAAGWACNVTTTETHLVTKTGPFYGGVVCCKDG